MKDESEGILSIWMGCLRERGLLIFVIWFLAACAGPSAAPVVTPDEQEAQKSYFYIQAILAKEDASIDYDTLMDVYRKMVSSPVPIPHTEALLTALIDQRNADPRIDQMVLILAALVIGESKFPIPDVEALFNRILDQDDDRISHWVLMFVADAIGSYPVDLPGGDALVDRVQAWQARIDSRPATEKEYFGTHFLPPPKSPTIRTHIAGIGDRKARQRERSAYYMLIMNNISENTIVAAVDYVKTHDLPGNGETPRYPLAFLVENWHRLPDEIKRHQP